VPVPRFGAAVLLLAAAVALVATGPLLPLCARAAALPILGAAAVLATLGWRALRALTFPIAFLLFLIPPPATGLAQVSGSLQTLAAFGTEHLLHGLSIPVTRVGLELRIGRDVLEITEACNGLRFLLTMIVVGVAFAWAAARTRGGGLVIVAAMALTAIAANVARVSVTAILTHLVGVQAATGPAHLVYGKLVYAVFGAALFLAVWRRAVRRG
jgi:exosortase